MRKLMLLGGTRYALPVIEAAHRLGMYVITADYLPDNVAHQYSDEYCNVSIVDKEAVLKEARERSVDGILSFACDPGVVSAAYVAEQMGLPSPGPYDSVCILQNKGRFRKFLEENAFNTPKARSYHCIEEALQDRTDFSWPVIVKPTDSAGSKGVTKVNTPEQLKDALAFAFEKSISGEVIIEEFIDAQGPASGSDSFVVDGRLVFASFDDQLFDRQAKNPFTPSAHTWPSTMPEEKQNELKKEIQRLLDLLHMKTSLYNIEARIGRDGKPYIMECSPRGGGNRIAECLELATGVKLVENAVRAAVGLPLSEIRQDPYDGYWALIILHSQQAGFFDSLWIDPEIRKYVREEEVRTSPGSRVTGFSAANESLGSLFMRFDSREQMQQVMDHSDKWIKVCLKDKDEENNGI